MEIKYRKEWVAHHYVHLVTADFDGITTAEYVDFEYPDVNEDEYMEWFRVEARRRILTFRNSLKWYKRRKAKRKKRN